MPSPLILVNLKTYKEGTGSRAHMIAQAAELVAKESGAKKIARKPVSSNSVSHW